MNEQQEANVIAAVKEASEHWKGAFNSGDAAGCAGQYEESAVMKAEPFGTFEGSAAIEGFWQKLIDDGFSDVEYLEPKLEVIDEESALLTSGWRMNKAQGVIHRELWKIQGDGSAKLREDHFEAKA
ncbi:MAG: YybH family protein [Verrucomicrobiales bacterium]